MTTFQIFVGVDVCIYLGKCGGGFPECPIFPFPSLHLKKTPNLKGYNKYFWICCKALKGVCEPTSGFNSICISSIYVKYIRIALFFLFCTLPPLYVQSPLHILAFLVSKYFTPKQKILQSAANKEGRSFRITAHFSFPAVR